MKLAHPPSTKKDNNITILIGADYYWKFVEDHVIHGNGPTAVASKLGYLLSGPCYNDSYQMTTSSFHVMAQPTNQNLDDMLTRFWDLQSIGITGVSKQKTADCDLQEFQEKYIEKQGNHYVAKLPWKEEQTPLPVTMKM